MPCLHLIPAPDSSHPRCALRRYGGRPSPGTCAICPLHTPAPLPPLPPGEGWGEGSAPLREPPPNPAARLLALLTPDQRLRLDSRRALCSACPHNAALTQLTVRCTATRLTSASSVEPSSPKSRDPAADPRIPTFSARPSEPPSPASGGCSCSALSLLSARCPRNHW